MPEATLRDLQQSDLDLLRHWRNHPDVRRYMYTRHEIGESEHRRWFERAHADPARHLWLFELCGRPAGFVNLTERGGGVADWGFYLAPDAPRGSGWELGKLALRRAFTSLGLSKVCGEALAYNERSIRFHVRLGFHEEGRLREQHDDGDDRHDVICFGLLRREWAGREGGAPDVDSPD
ncbi:N-acetyltransferase GCN5 [Alcanivorax sp. 521-1]|uniref:N-acetyltransferase GCN5 n=1 Tax=Alloalcanivorax profundimaris TaxID=2735259 RepID=A0ABS0AVA9_9GAMM|nr:UDP-4-amino-4,6-dideoxy-N-acetyl-beta-L-altrosamine N-acetyltransferase [Alloalcanivorax profundimaris]MBF5058084.1 N-acetyltransferase GCN5 [Alloalcanivorax profundimaris]MCQ6262009.1 UDP-4-amino-4,6-dideoxy-N-acetyl-beta-L-altrosamine N-acetyltransferase [Alcanivorax sp. MM125-6]